MAVGCSSKDPLPISTWSAGCVGFAPYQEGYRLDGICCAYIVLPKVKLDKSHTFTVKADYYTFTGASYVPIPTVVKGQLSSDGKVLTITYSINALASTHRLQPGAVTTFCYCACD